MTEIHQTHYTTFKQLFNALAESTSAAQARPIVEQIKGKFKDEVVAPVIQRNHDIEKSRTAYDEPYSIERVEKQIENTKISIEAGNDLLTAFRAQKDIHQHANDVYLSTPSTSLPASPSKAEARQNALSALENVLQPYFEQ